jgi:hypothetical protein
MRPGIIIAIVMTTIICFVAGFVSGNAQDHWKVANQASCVANIQIVDPGPSGASRPRAYGPHLIGGGREFAIQGAFQQIERCDDLSGLATLEPLAAARLNAMILNPGH